MQRRQILALCGATTALAVTPAASALAAKVTVRVEGKTHTLLAPTVVTTGSGSVTKFGAPSGKCSASSAAGALDLATHHKWAGKWYSSFGDYFLTGVLGESYATSKTYSWGIWINNRSASTGACGIKLHAGDQLLFAAEPTKIQDPIGVIAPAQVRKGHKLTVKVVAYSAAGKATPLGGALVSVNGHSGKTDKRGQVSLTPSKPGSFVLTATHAGYIRAAPVTVRVTP
jgi:hypothetical protein